MAEGGGISRKLMVEICNARNLMPKDGQGTASAYVIVDFDGQRRRTKTRLRDLNPQWDERLEFLVHDPDVMASETLEVNVYNDKKTGKRSTFLGKVKISGATFPKSGSETLVYYPLEKRSVFSQIKGEIGLKISYEDEASSPQAAAAAPDAAPAAADPKPEDQSKKAEEETKKPDEETKEKDKEEAKKPNEEEEKKAEENSKPEEAKKTEENPKPAEEKTPKVSLKEKEEKQLEPAVAVSSPSKISSVGGVGGELDIRSLCGDRTGVSSYDLVERVPYLFVRVLKAKHAAGPDRPVYAKVAIGTHSVRTRMAKKAEAEWDQVFAFHKASLNSTALDVSVWAEKKDSADGAAAAVTDTCLGVVSFDLQEIPKRSPPDSPLAPQWYTLEGSSENAIGNDVMVATWLGTQVDEAFQEAWQSDSGGHIVHTRSKAYLSPKLWYLRLTVIQTQDLRLGGAAAEPKARELYVKAQLGVQVFKTAKTAPSSPGSANPPWNEDLVFVAAEPFDPFLLIIVEDASSGHAVGHAKVHVSSIHRRVDDRSEPPSRWFNLGTGSDSEGRTYAGRIHVRVCLEGGYHVLDEAAHVASDVRAASKQLSKPPVGLLEVGIRGAANLLPMKAAGKDGSTGCGYTDAYVVLKYGPKWARTRTILDQFNPRWNEQYTWDVYDPCTVLTVGVFDNARYDNSNNNKDVRIGKLRIRLSTLDTNRVYLNSYPLTAVHPGFGAKKMGEIELAVRFTCASWVGLIQAYVTPMLPRMHYVRPLGPAQQDLLRHTAMRIVSARLARSEPPLGPEVVQYMLDTDAHVWSMRRSKANWFRVVACLSWAVGAARWVHSVRTWTHPSTTVLVHMLLAAVVLCPGLILPTAFMYVFLYVTLRYRGRAAGPAAGMDPRLSCADSVGPDELDEEFDGIPSGRPAEQVRVRYDRLRTLAGRAQALLGDVAAQGERVEALVTWRDPRATGIFVGFCFLAAVVFYAVPFRALALAGGFYYLRHPRFRGDMPSAPVSFFRRLPSLSDRIL